MAIKWFNRKNKPLQSQRERERDGQTDREHTYMYTNNHFLYVLCIHVLFMHGCLVTLGLRELISMVPVCPSQASHTLQMPLLTALKEKPIPTPVGECDCFSLTFPPSILSFFLSVCSYLISFSCHSLTLSLSCSPLITLSLFSTAIKVS